MERFFAREYSLIPDSNAEDDRGFCGLQFLIVLAYQMPLLRKEALWAEGEGLFPLPVSYERIEWESTEIAEYS